MIRKYLLSLNVKPTRSMIPFKGKYTTKDGNHVVLTPLKRAYIGTNVDELKKKGMIKEFLSIQNPFIEYSIDDTKQEEVKFIEYLSRHTDVVSFNKDHVSRNPIFRLIDTTGELENKVMDIKDKLTIANKVNSLPKTKIRDLCYYLKINVFGKSYSELYQELLDFNTGYAYTNAETVEKYMTDEDAIIKVIVNKALYLNGGIIKHEEGYPYTFGTIELGRTLYEVYEYMKDNKHPFESLKNEVQMYDKLPEDIKYEDEEKPKEKTELPTKTLKDLRMEAEHLGVKKWHLLGVENLKIAIQEAQEKKQREIEKVNN